MADDSQQLLKGVTTSTGSSCCGDEDDVLAYVRSHGVRINACCAAEKSSSASVHGRSGRDVRVHAGTCRGVVSITDDCDVWEYVERDVTEQFSCGAVVPMGMDCAKVGNGAPPVGSFSHTLFGGPLGRMDMLPLVHLYLVCCESMEDYRARIRPRIRAWVSGIKESGEEWLLIYTSMNAVASGIVADSAPPHIRQEEAAESPAQKSEGALTAGLRIREAWTKALGSLASRKRRETNQAEVCERVFEKLKVDFTSDKNIVRCCMLASRTMDSPASPSTKQFKSRRRKRRAKHLVAALDMALLRTLEARSASYTEQSTRLLSQVKVPGWNYCTYFIARENLAFAYLQYSDFKRALEVYRELESLYIDCKRRAAGREMPLGVLPTPVESSAPLSEGAIHELLTQSYSGILNPAAKDYHDMLQRSSINDSDLMAYIFARKATLLFSLRKPHEALQAGLGYIRSCVNARDAPRMWVWGLRACLELTEASWYLEGSRGRFGEAAVDAEHIANIAQSMLLSADAVQRYQRALGDLYALALCYLERVWKSLGSGDGNRFSASEFVAAEYLEKHLMADSANPVCCCKSKDAHSLPILCPSACRMYFYRAISQRYEQGKRGRFASRYDMLLARTMMHMQQHKKARTILSNACNVWSAAKVAESDYVNRKFGRRLQNRDDWPPLYFYARVLLARCNFVTGTETDNMHAFFREVLSLLDPDVLWRVPEAWRVAAQKAFCASALLAQKLHAFSIEQFRFLELGFHFIPQKGVVAQRDAVSLECIIRSWLPAKIVFSELGIEAVDENGQSSVGCTVRDVTVSPGENRVVLAGIVPRVAGNHYCKMLWIKKHDLLLTCTTSIASLGPLFLASDS